jgi:hypothetical protein
MTDTTYNGWTNYPTWCVNLWLDNDEYSQAESHELVVRAYKKGMAAAKTFVYSRDWPVDTHQAYARSIATDALKEYVEELLNDERADLGSDLQSWALGQVDWREIVTNWLTDDLDNDEEATDDEDDGTV